MSKTKKQLIAEQTEFLQDIAEYKSALEDERIRADAFARRNQELQTEYAKLEKLYQSVADDTARFYKDENGKVIEVVGSAGEVNALKVKLTKLENDNADLKRVLKRVLEQHRTNSNSEAERSAAKLGAYKEALGLVLDKALR